MELLYNLHTYIDSHLSHDTQAFLANGAIKRLITILLAFKQNQLLDNTTIMHKTTTTTAAAKLVEKSHLNWTTEHNVENREKVYFAGQLHNIHTYSHRHSISNCNVYENVCVAVYRVQLSENSLCEDEKVWNRKHESELKNISKTTYTNVRYSCFFPYVYSYSYNSLTCIVDMHPHFTKIKWIKKANETKAQSREMLNKKKLKTENKNKKKMKKKKKHVHNNTATSLHEKYAYIT